MTARLAALGVLLTLLFAAPFVQAEDSVARAEALFRAGRDSMRQGDYPRACDQFRESDRLDPQPGTKLNLGGCDEKRGRLATALELFRSVVRELPADDKRVKIAQERVSALEPRIPQVTFKLAAGAPASTSVRLSTDEQAKVTLGTAMPLDPGKHEVVVAAPGFTERRFALELAEGEQRDVEVAPGPKESESGAAVDVDSDRAEPGSNKTLGYVLGGVGIAGVAVGTITGIMVLGKKSTFEDECKGDPVVCSQEGADARDSGRTLGTVSTIGFVVGAVGLGAGAYFLLSSNDDGGKTGVRVRPNRSGAFLSLQHTW